MGQDSYAVEVVVCGLVDVDGGAAIALAAADVAARGDDVHRDSASNVDRSDDSGRRGESGLYRVWDTQGGEADRGRQLDSTLGRNGGDEEGCPECRGGVHTGRLLGEVLLERMDGRN